MCPSAMLPKPTRPQEAGHRGGVRSLTVHGEGGTLTITTSPDGTGLLPGFSISPWTPQEVAASQHVEELPVSNRSWLTLDARHSGLGTASCGPGIGPEFRVHPESVTMAFTVRIDRADPMGD